VLARQLGQRGALSGAVGPSAGGPKAFPKPRIGTHARPPQPHASTRTSRPGPQRSSLVSSESSLRSEIAAGASVSPPRSTVKKFARRCLFSRCARKASWCSTSSFACVDEARALPHVAGFPGLGVSGRGRRRPWPLPPPALRTARAVLPRAALTGHSPSGGSSLPCSESAAGD
jgi:hypothetical protein